MYHISGKALPIRYLPLYLQENVVILNFVPPKDIGHERSGLTLKHKVYKANSNSGELPIKMVFTGFSSS